MRRAALAFVAMIALAAAAACGGDGSSGQATAPPPSTAEPEEIALSSALGIALLPNGDLLIADGDAGRVVRADLESGRLSALPSEGLVAPTGIDVAPDGTVYVADRHARAVFRLEDGAVTRLAEYGEPLDVAVDSQGSVFVTGRENTVVEIDPESGDTTPYAGTGEDASTGNGGPALEASLAAPHGVAVTPDDQVVVAELASVRQIDPAGAIHAIAGTGERQLCAEEGPARRVCLTAIRVAFAPNGEFFVADPENARLWHVSGDLARALDLGFPPLDVAVESPGTVLVADNEGRRIVRYDVSSGATVPVVE
jgi:DNA-binding beta-propeller fold protein YncE